MLHIKMQFLPYVHYEEEVPTAVLQRKGHDQSEDTEQSQDTDDVKKVSQSAARMGATESSLPELKGKLSKNVSPHRDLQRTDFAVPDLVFSTSEVEKPDSLFVSAPVRNRSVHHRSDLPFKVRICVQPAGLEGADCRGLMFLPRIQSQSHCVEHFCFQCEFASKGTIVRL